MRIAFLTARGTADLDGLLQHSRRGSLYEVAGVISAATSDVPRNLRERELHDARTAALLRGLGAETIFAAGYPYVLTEPMLDAFPDRIIAVHDGDLTDVDAAGRRRWVGLHAVREAILSGAEATRSSLYIVTRDVGHGPLLLVGPRHAVSPLVRDAITGGDYAAVKAYASLHRAWMRRSWSALILQAIELLVGGTIQITGNTVWIDGVPGACRLGEPPDACETPQPHDIPGWCPFIQR